MPRRKKKSAIKVRISTDREAPINSFEGNSSVEKKKQSKEERLEKKRQAEKRRLEKIRSDPELYAEFKAKQRESYHKRKAAKKILPISEMSAKDKKKIRKRNRDNFRAYYHRKKQRKRLDVLLEENNLPETDEENQGAVLVNIPDSPIMRTPSPSILDVPYLPVAGPSSSYALNEHIRSNSATPSLNATLRRTRYMSPLYSPGSPCSSVSTAGPSSSCTLNEHIRSNSATPSLNVTFRRTRYVSPLCSPGSPCSSVSTTASRSAHKAALRRYKYQRDKEVAALRLKLKEVLRSKEIYRKKFERLRKRTYKPDDITGNKEKTTRRQKHVTKSEKMNKAIAAVKKDVEIFYENDENSRVCPGKKEFVKKGPEKRQKRFLNDSLKNLYDKYRRTSAHSNISYTTFCRFRPFWVRIPDSKARDTCVCQIHANMRLLIDALKRRNIISESSCTDVIKSLTCRHEEVNCLQRKCLLCAKRFINFKEFDDSQPIFYWRWLKKSNIYVKEGVEKTSKITEKIKIQTNPRAAIEDFDKKLIPFLQHCANITNQYAAIKIIKEGLTTEDCIIHCDYSENYMTKYAEEVQSAHFGGSKRQLTLHTAILYYFDQTDNKTYKTQAFCTISENTRHDAAAVWAHFVPLLRFIQENTPQVKTLHVISDSPSSQYRNKKVFFFIPKLYWHLDSLEKITWNYSESGHGKGAPDGVGGVLKRTADQIVAYGQDIADIDALLGHLRVRVPGVLLEVVSDYDIYEKDLLMQTGDIKPFPGTLKTHQVVWNKQHGSQLTMRKLTCTAPDCLSNFLRCPHGHHIGFHIVEKEYPAAFSSHPSVPAPSHVHFTSQSLMPVLNQFQVTVPSQSTVSVSDHLSHSTFEADSQDITDREAVNDRGENLCITTISELGLSKYINDDQSLPNVDCELLLNSWITEDNSSSIQPVDHNTSVNHTGTGDLVLPNNKLCEPNKNQLLDNPDNNNTLPMILQQAKISHITTGGATIGSWVVVEYKMKRNCKYYAGQVTDVNDDEFTVTFLRHVKDTYFTWPTEPDVDTVSSSSIKQVLSEPTLNRRAQVVFKDINTTYHLE